MGTRAKSMRQDNPGTKRSGYASTGARLFLGLLFLIFGLNGFCSSCRNQKTFLTGHSRSQWRL